MKNSLFLILFIALTVITNAQRESVQQKILSKDGTVKMIIFDTTKIYLKETSSVQVINQYFKLSDNDKLVLKTKSVDDWGVKHSRYMQYYNGIKVENAEIIVHSRNGIILSINGKAGINIKSNITPKLNSESVIEIAKHRLGAKKYAWESPEMESYIKNIRNDQSATYVPNPVLVLWNNFDSTDYNLAYKFSIATVEPYNNYNFYIDAQTGKILTYQNLVINSNPSKPLGRSDAIGTAVTRYSGTVSINTTYVAWPFYDLLDNTRGQGIETLDCNGGVPAGAVPFYDNDDVWNEWHNSAKDDAALDAHYAGMKTYDYFKFNHNRNGWDSNNGKLFIYVHCPVEGDNDNAGWDNDLQVILCGDGTGNDDPFTSIETIGHEFGHGVTQSFVDLYPLGEPAAINEGLSQIWGICVEEYANLPGSQKWIEGEHYIYDPSLRRNFRCPDSSYYYDTYLQYTYPYPDCFEGPGWNWTSYDFNGIHEKSVVFAHWFYLLSQGGGDTVRNSLGFYYAVSGVGTTIASNIVYNLYNYLIPSTDFSALRYYCILAASTMYGVNSNIAIQTNNAWSACNVGTEVPNLLSGSYFICSSSNSTYSLPSEFEGQYITWTTSSNINIVSGQGTRIITVSRNENQNGGNGTITAVYNHGHGDITCQKTVWVGLPEMPSVYPVCDDPYHPFIMNLYDETYLDIVSSPGAGWDTGYWISEGVCYTESQGRYMYVYAAEEGGTVFWVTTSNDCGTSPEYFGGIQVGQEEKSKSGGNSLSFDISPNPSTSYVDIKLTDNKNSNLINNFKVEFIDPYARIVKAAKLTGPFNRINVQDLSVGYYVIRLTFDGKIYQKTMIKQK